MGRGERLLGGLIASIALCLTLPALASAATFTAAATDAELGNAVHADATLAGGAAPTGTIDFTAFAPADPTCAGAPVFADSVPVNDNGEYSSADFTPLHAGTYHWTAAYSGDLNNAPESSVCLATSVVSQATPALTTLATSAVIGSAVHDTATLSGGAAPTGSLVFKAFGPADVSCSNPAAFTATIPVAGNGGYESGDFTASQAGSYRWTVAYSGDADNAATESPCNSANETSTVSQVTPALGSTATNAVVGAAITDSANLSGGFVPTGTLTFKAFGPNDTNCSNAAAYSNTVSVAGNGSYGSGNFTTSAAGAYRWTVAYSGDANNAAASSPCEAANETSTVGKASPTISTTATSGSIGTAIKDTATIAAGITPTGNLVFKAFGPNDATCAGAAAFTKTVAVAGNGAYESTNFTPSAIGAYRWTAEYAGDADNNPVTSPCNAANETSTVTQVTPTLSSTATNAAVGAAISDSATLAGGASPTGTLTFKAFGPNDATCSGAAVYSNTVSVAGAGSYGSGNFTTSAAGAYRWTVAYSGDANNGSTTSPCNAANETSTVTQVTPALSSTATNGTAGAAITDSATLSGGFTPSGTLTFKAFGPNDATCATTAAFSKTVSVNGNGAYGSGNFTPTAAGSYRWTIEYSGDTNNATTTSPCNAANETSTVGKASPTISSTATSAGIGTAIKDTATLAGGVTPSGNLVFKAFGPNDATCTGTVAFTKTAAVAGTGGESGNFTPIAVGTYRWTVEYSGDANNNPVTSSCNAANETSTVGKASPTISSTAASTIYPGSISDAAMIAGGSTPTGTLTFKAFGPDNATCAGAATYTKAVTLNGAVSYGSGDYSPIAVGSYRWTVEYSGDPNNNPTSSGCNAANETSTVAKVPPALGITTGNAAIGGAIASLATFGGGISHTGQIVFRAYGPDDPSCAGSPVYALALTVTAGNSTYASGQFTPAQAGAFRWTASYSGDAINAAETTACAAALASVAPAVPTLSTHISATSITAGDGVRSAATLAAGFKPTGTITFRLFGPSDTTCSGVPALTTTATVSGNATYTSAPLVPRQAGDFRFTATYSGDTGNTAVVAACGAGGEFVQVEKRTPTLKARASVRGKKIVAKATLGAAASPLGKVTFRIYAPGDKRCSRKPVFSSQAAVHGTGNYRSAGFRFETSGLYRFTVAYSGDERNKSVKKGCATRGQSIRVS
jgi:hypothetical protein